MNYPPASRLSTDHATTRDIMKRHPFAHFFTSHGALRTTRIPFVTDEVDQRPTRLRAHLNGSNPQAEGLDGVSALVVFSGPASYVSPHWRANKTRGGTYDYEEVRVHGTVRVVADIEFFCQLIDDLSRLIEPQYASAGNYPIWQTTMAADGYIERLFPHVTPLAIEIDSVQTISKLHQEFPAEDRRSVSEHLLRVGREGAEMLGNKIRRQLDEDLNSP